MALGRKFWHLGFIGIGLLVHLLLGVLVRLLNKVQIFVAYSLGFGLLVARVRSCGVFLTARQVLGAPMQRLTQKAANSPESPVPLN